MYGTLKKIIAFAGSKEGLLKKSLLFALLSGLFAALQFAALFIVVEALVSDNRDSRFIWISLGIMAVSLVGRIITTYFSTMEQTETGYCMVAKSVSTSEIGCVTSRWDILTRTVSGTLPLSLPPR